MTIKHFLILYSAICAVIGLTGKSMCQDFRPTTPQSSSLSKMQANVRISRDECNPLTFSHFLKIATDQNHIMILAEDEPMLYRLPMETVQYLRTKTVTEAGKDSSHVWNIPLERLADAFDYYIVPTKYGILLVKKYTDGRDIPPVTIPESYATLIDITRMVKPFKSGIEDAVHCDETANLANSLTLDQLRQMMRPEGLEFDHFNAEQQQTIERLNRYYCIDKKLEAIVEKRDIIERLMDSDAVLLWKPDYPKSSIIRFGFAGKTSREKQPVFTPFYNAKLPLLPNSTIYLKQSQPKIGYALPEPLRIKTQSTTITLANLMQLLNTQAQGTIHFKVDEVIQGKPLSVAGLKFALPTDTLRAVAMLYRLRFNASEGHYYLSRMRAPLPASITEVPSSVYRCIPVSMLRFAHIETPAYAPNLGTGAGEYKSARYYVGTPLEAISTYVQMDISIPEDKRSTTQMKVATLSEKAKKHLAVYPLILTLSDLRLLLDDSRWQQATDIVQSSINGGFATSEGRPCFSLFLPSGGFGMALDMPNNRIRFRPLPKVPQPEKTP